MIAFNVMIHGRSGHGVARRIIRAIGNGGRTAPETCYVTAWSEEDCRWAIMVPIPRGDCRRRWAESAACPLTYPITAMMAVGTLML